MRRAETGGQIKKLCSRAFAGLQQEIQRRKCRDLVHNQLTYWKRLFDGELITKADYEKKKEEVLAGATALLPARPAASSTGWL